MDQASEGLKTRLSERDYKRRQKAVRNKLDDATKFRPYCKLRQCFIVWIALQSLDFFVMFGT